MSQCQEGQNKGQISNVEVSEDTKKSQSVSINEYLLRVSDVEDSNSVDTFATKVESPMTTNEPLLTRICIGNVANMTFEIDTVASHSILSQDIFNRLLPDDAIDYCAQRSKYCMDHNDPIRCHT